MDTDTQEVTLLFRGEVVTTGRTILPEVVGTWRGQEETVQTTTDGGHFTFAPTMMEEVVREAPCPFCSPVDISKLYGYIGRTDDEEGNIVTASQWRYCPVCGHFIERNTEERERRE